MYKIMEADAISLTSRRGKNLGYKLQGPAMFQVNKVSHNSRKITEQALIDRAKGRGFKIIQVLFMLFIIQDNSRLQKD